MDFYGDNRSQHYRPSAYNPPPKGYDYDQNISYYDPNNANQYMSERPQSSQTYYSDCYGTHDNTGAYDEIEPPLLEELEIDLFLIRKRVIAILDPFNSGVIMGSYDLAGPFLICLLFAVCSFLSGAKINFNHIYILSAFCCVFMYILLNLMLGSEEITLSSVTSVLGYSLLPLALLSGLGIFVNLYSVFGMVCSALAVCWCSYAATKMFSTFGNDADRKLVIAYPCLLCYGVFTLCLMFK